MRITISEKELLHPGYRRVYTPPGQVQEETLTPGKGRLRDLKMGQKIKPRRVRAHRQSLNEAGLIALMQSGGIGRPSTYAVIIDTLLQRKYIQKEQGGGLMVTDRGQAALAFLVSEYPELFSLEFSIRMEKRLDEIAAANLRYEEVIRMIQRQLD